LPDDRINIWYSIEDFRGSESYEDVVWQKYGILHAPFEALRLVKETHAEFKDKLPLFLEKFTMIQSKTYADVINNNPIKEIKEMWIKRGEEDENNTSDFTLFIFDDYKVLLKVDKCGVHEAVKHLEDQEIAFLSYCWTGFVEDTLNKRSRRRRTTQTLHLSDFCDEFYWDNNVHPDAKQPPLDELMKLIEESES